MALNFRFDNSYIRLPERFYARHAPGRVAAPQLIALNGELARELDLDERALASAEGLAVLCGNVVADGAAPIAMAYAGHQFGHFVPQLGDGRALLLGEVVGRDGILRDLHLKGVGRTPFSRQGDGRAALGPVLREYLVSEAMTALGVPSTRALAALATGDEIWRDGPVPGALLVRVAQSHIRVGTFQYFAARGDSEGVQLLADYVVARIYPELVARQNPYVALLRAVIARQAALIAHWLLLGFIHGVMNTDNMSIAGETIDYGPCAFMDSYDPLKVFSSIDQSGRYAFARQPQIAAWNLARFAETLLPLLGDDEELQLAQANAALAEFAGCFERHYRQGLGVKIGLDGEDEGAVELGQDLLTRMAEGRADFTLVFRGLASAVEEPAADQTLRQLFNVPQLYDEWAARWRAQLARSAAGDRAHRMRRANPRYIPRNHRIEQVIAAAYSGDFAPFYRLSRLLRAPYDEQPECAEYAAPPAPDEEVSKTFCGT